MAYNHQPSQIFNHKKVRNDSFTAILPSKKLRKNLKKYLSLN